MTSEPRELELVGKVEMRIALAKDDKLEPMLKVYLPPLLLKLASEHQAVRNQVGSPRSPKRAHSGCDFLTLSGDFNMSAH